MISITSLPIIIKGILAREDAALAIQRGVSGIYVSNPGGRQVDSAPASVRKTNIFIFKIK